MCICVSVRERPIEREKGRKGLRVCTLVRERVRKRKTERRKKKTIERKGGRSERVRKRGSMCVFAFVRYRPTESDGDGACVRMVFPPPTHLYVQLLCFDLLTRPKMPFKVMHRKKVTHSNGSYERKSRGRKLADEMGRAKKNSHGTVQSDAPEENDL